MKSLIDRFMDGLEFRDPSRADPRPLDFAVSNDTKTLLLLTNWWTVQWGMEEGLLVIAGVLNPETLRFDGLEGTGLHLGPATDGFFEAHLNAARRLTDIDRGRYVIALQRLVDFEPDFDFSPWIEAVLTRPTVDPIKEMHARQTALRTVGMIRLLDAAGTPVDALVIDEHGQVATSQDDGWLALFATQWAGYADDERPAVDAFLGWLKQQAPYGPFSLDEPMTASEEGELQALIPRALKPNAA